MRFEKILPMFPATLAAIAVSCVNDEYDLGREIDKTIEIGGDISAPLGSTELISIDDFFNIDPENGSILKTDNITGDYYLSVTGSGDNSRISVPYFTFEDDLVKKGGLKMEIGRQEIISAIAPGIPSTAWESTRIPSGTIYRPTCLQVLTPLQMDEAIPEEVVDIKDVTGEATVTLRFGNNAGAIDVSGLNIDFPDYIKFGEILGTYKSFNPSGNIISFDTFTTTSTDIIVTMEVTDIDFSALPEGQGFLPSEHRAVIDDNIIMSAVTAEARMDSFGTFLSDIPLVTKLDLEINISRMNLANATVKVRPEINIAPQIAEVGELPDFLKEEGVLLDLYNPVVNLGVNNTSPLPVILNADLVSWKGSQAVSVHIGDNGTASGTEQVRIPAKGYSTTSISILGTGGPEGTLNIAAPRLGDLFLSVPDRIGISAIDFEAADEFITVAPGETYTFGYDYELRAPLAAGKRLYIPFHYDIDGWNSTINPEDSEVTVNIEMATVTCDFINTIPLDYNLTGTALDIDGNALPDIHVDLDAEILAGSVQSPSTTPVTIRMSGSSENIKRLDGLRLVMLATGPENSASGIPLNSRQGIRMDNMKVRLQGAVDMEL
ncbi:MAG: hypothetical protein ACI3ZT_02275 [Candidatus Cryptobacteroides sp.]